MLDAILSMPGWFWWCVALVLTNFVANGVGQGFGFDQGVDHMKREAIRAGLAKPCNFDGGWRWKTWAELKPRCDLHARSPEPPPADVDNVRGDRS